MSRLCVEMARRDRPVDSDPSGVSLVQSQLPARIYLPQIESTANKTEDQCHSSRLTVTQRQLVELGGVLWQGCSAMRPLSGYDVGPGYDADCGSGTTDRR